MLFMLVAFMTLQHLYYDYIYIYMLVVSCINVANPIVHYLQYYHETGVKTRKNNPQLGGLLLVYHILCTWVSQILG